MFSFSKLTTLIIILLFIIVINNAISNTKIDSLETRINIEQNPQKKLDLYFQLFDELSDFADASILLKVEQANKLADSLNNPRYKAKALYYKGKTWRIWSNLEKSVEFLFSAKNLFKDLNDLPNLAETYRSIAETYRALGFYDLAIQYALKAEDMFSKLKDTIGLAKTYNRLAAIYFEKYHNAPEILSVWKDKETTSQIYSILAKNQKIKNTYDSLVRYLNLAYYYTKLCNDQKLYISTAIIDAGLQNNIGYIPKAKEILNNALQIAQSMQNLIDLPLIYYAIGNIYYKEKNYKKALEYSLKALELGKEFKIPIYIIISSKIIFEVYNDLKDYKNVNKYLSIYYDTRLEYMSTKAEAQVKVAEYESNLRNKEIQIQANKQATVIIVVSFILILTLIIISLIAIVRRNVKITRLNELLTQNNLQIIDKNLALEQLNKEKDRFFSIIAHDLKNPVSSFLLTMNMINESYDSFTAEELKVMFGLMKESSDSLYALLENLLEWSRSQRGAIKFMPAETDMKYLVEMATSPLKNQAFQKEVEIINTIPENYKIVIDPNLITTVIRNLVSNAIKFTPAGGKITLGIREEDAESVTFYVADTGVGISEENMKKLFRIDEQVTTLGTNKEKGTGLGLILCAEFVRKHFGKIWVESKIGEGTTFFVKLPKTLAPYKEETIN